MFINDDVQYRWSYKYVRFSLDGAAAIFYFTNTPWRDFTTVSRSLLLISVYMRSLLVVFFVKFIIM